MNPRTSAPEEGPFSAHWLAALGLMAAVCLVLAFDAGTSNWVMDADEAVHAVEGLRLFDALVHGEWMGFLERLYFPERWQAPVQDHLRWYGGVHKLSLLPSFALLGQNESGARLISVVWLALAWWGLLKLAQRVALRDEGWTVLGASLLLAGCPNLLTFAPQCLIETSALATAVLAFLAYLRFLDRLGDPWAAVRAGLALGLAVLTKYDHGLILVASLGSAELWRARGSPRALWVDRSWLLFASAAACFAAWVAHPDKWTAFLDTLEHPAYGNPRELVLNPLASLLVELTSAPAAAAALLVAWGFGARAARTPKLRALWLYASLSAVLLAVRGRFQFRYHYVEMAFALVLVAVLVPEWIARWCARLESAAAVGEQGRRDRSVRAAAAVFALIAVASALVLIWQARNPGGFQNAVRALVERPLAFLAPRLGLRASARDHALDVARGAEALVQLLRGGLLGAALAAALAACLCWTAGRGQLPHHATRERWAWVALLALVPGGMDFARTLPQRVNFEYEAAPILRKVLEYVRHSAAGRRRVLLAGGFDQLANNTLRFELLCRPEHGAPRFDDVEVVGDMIGSLVLPPGPRIEHWSAILREAGESEQPDLVLILEPHAEFHYHLSVLAAAEEYRQAMQARGGWRPLPSAPRAFPELGCTVELWERDRAQPLGPAAPRAGDPAEFERVVRSVGEAGWRVRDDAWRHLRNPFLFPGRTGIAP
jgi:4-amino-4-deoxy-L-arabinose transferase-like glycosyltransferase